jgi:peptidoglycan/xylan/chitin deacetylase (PgdA/CDA1 family)
MKARVTVRIVLATGILAAITFAAYEILESPGNQVFGQTVVRGPADEKVIALTYDDGPNPPYTDRILDVLRREHVHATFFLVGRAVAAYPHVVQQELKDGDAVGNHTWDHAHLVLYNPTNLRDTLQRTDDAIFDATGQRSRIMRPPYGGRDWLVLGEVRKLGYTPVMWSVPLANDWEYPTPAVIAERVLRYAGDGSIIDLHDGNQGILCATAHVAPHVCDRDSDVEATRLIVESLKRQGYRFVTIPELLRLDRAVTRTVSRSGG